MKRRKISFSPYLLIPAIFSGVSLLTVIATYHVVSRYSGLMADPAKPVFWLGLSVVVITFVGTYVILRFVLLPISRFVKIARTLPAMSHMPVSEVNGASDNSENIEELHRVLDQVTTILSKVETRELFPGIIGQSQSVQAIFGQILKVAPKDTTVLISGESGTGKELVAAALYEHSSRRGKPFIKVNCVAIPEGLLESELFGHEKGAFTGAVARKKGKFELADGGTIFLDEIGDMPPATQAKILRVLQEREFERVGGAGSIQVDVRIIAATNKNLMEMVKTGAFREDLFYRLNVFNIHLPALRERREDIPILADHFLGFGSEEKALQIAPRAMQFLLDHPWPGNVRELQNVIERAAVISEGRIEPGHLPPEFHGDAGMPANRGGEDDGKSLDERLGKIEKGIIIEAITRAEGVQVRAAKLLGINQRSLWHRIKKYNIDVSSFKNL